MPRLYMLLLIAAPVTLFATLSAQQPVAGAVTPCILQSGTQHCSEASVKYAIGVASSIQVASGPRDKVGERELRSLVGKLGKSLALNPEAADLLIQLSATEQGGINYGATDRDLARLEVYAPVGPARRLQLIWTETLSGPADLSWPATVSRLLSQFGNRVKAG